MAAFKMSTWKVMFMFYLATIFFNLQQYCVYGEVPCLFIFGDSLSDAGNNNQLQTLIRSNYNPNGIDFSVGPTGRFTNGRTSVDIITQLLGFENFIPPYVSVVSGTADIMKGVNYASGGAGIRVETSSHLGHVLNLGSQLALHKDVVSQISSRLGSPDKAQEYLKKCLFYVNIARNDYTNNYFFPSYPTSRYIYSPEQYAIALTEELSSNLLALHDMGGRKFVLVGLEPIGCTPYAMLTNLRISSCVEEWNAAGFIFNIKLKSLVDFFNNNFSIDSKFVFVNSASLSLQYSDGFAVSNVACCPSLIALCVPNGMPCSNRKEYVFWDQLHTTEEWNLITAITSYNASNPSVTYPMDIKHLVDYI